MTLLREVSRCKGHGAGPPKMEDRDRDLHIGHLICLLPYSAVMQGRVGLNISVGRLSSFPSKYMADAGFELRVICQMPSPCSTYLVSSASFSDILQVTIFKAPPGDWD